MEIEDLMLTFLKDLKNKKRYNRQLWRGYGNKSSGGGSSIW